MHIATVQKRIEQSDGVAHGNVSRAIGCIGIRAYPAPIRIQKCHHIPLEVGDVVERLVVHGHGQGASIIYLLDTSHFLALRHLSIILCLASSFGINFSDQFFSNLRMLENTVMCQHPILTLKLIACVQNIST